MARKKTVATSPATTIRGEVVVTKLKNGVPIKKTTLHNNAVANLLIGVARYLRGDFLNLTNEGTSFIPGFLGVGYTETAATTSFTQTHLASELEVYENRFDVSKGGVTIEADVSKVKLSLSAVIPSGSLPVGTNINEIGLFAQRKRADSGMLARMVYLMPDGETLAKQSNDALGDYHIKVEQGMSYQIDWNILLSNK